MAKLEQKIMPCGGGMIQFGTTGMANTVYLTKYSSCASPYQDERYGKGMRLHNPQGGKSEGKFRCTVCGNGAGVVRI